MGNAPFPMGPPPGGRVDESLKEKKPKSVKEIPLYLKNVFGKFFFRLFYIFRLVWDTKKWVMAVMSLLSVLSGILPVLSAFVASLLINALAAAYVAGAQSFSDKFPQIAALLVLQFACIFALTLTSNINTLVTRITGELVVNHVNVKMMSKAQSIDLKSFDNPEFYARLENASREADRRPVQILSSVFTIISTLISVISFIAILWAVSPTAPFIVLALAIPSGIISFVFRKKNFLYMRRRSKNRRQLTYYSSLMTNKDLVKEVRIFGLSGELIKRYGDIFTVYFTGLKKLFINEGSWNIGIAMLSAAANCIIFLYVAKKVMLGEIMVGDYSLYTGALNSISSGIAVFIATSSSIYEGTLFIDNLIAFMGEEKTVVPVLPTGMEKPRKLVRHVGHRFVFENVSFRYPGTSRDVIKNVSFTLNPGDTVVLVGLNGAGKTTLIKLLTRLYDPTQGRILLDGYDIREYAVEDLYSAIGIIFQDFGKYAVTVGENIAFGQIDEPYKEDRIKTAAVQSGSSGFIEELAQKYDTPLMRYFEEDGVELSVGQWQKLSVARAFYSNSDILILDEPTASLDAIAEQEIYAQFDTLRRDKTTVFVSHRLSSATAADKILVLSQGALIEEGRHSELMAQKGEYYKLFSAQAKRYIENADIIIKGEGSGGNRN